MCVTLGFKDGKIKNSPDDQQTGFCASYEGKNYCGPEKMPIHFMGFVCDNIPDLKDIFGCGKKGAESCTHQNDLIIECLTTDMNQKQTPPDGTLRIMGHDG